MKRSHLAIAFYMLVVFASGIAVGAFGHLYTVRASSQTPDDWRQKYVKELQSRLALDQGQVAGLNAILDTTKSKTKAVKEKYRPEMKAVYQEQMSSMRAMLNPSQQAEYAKIVAEREKRMREDHRR